MVSVQDPEEGVSTVYLGEDQRRTALPCRIFGVNRRHQDLFALLAFLHHPLPHVQRLSLSGVGAQVWEGHWGRACVRAGGRPGTPQGQEGWERAALQGGFPEHTRGMTLKVRTHFNHSDCSPNWFVCSVTGQVEI